MTQFQDVWNNAADVSGSGDAEIVKAGDYAVKLVKAGVSDSDRIWTLFEITTGEDAGTTFFGSKYGLTGGDADKTAKAQGFFKKAMTEFGITEAFFNAATSLDDFTTAIEGVEGNAKVKVRDFKLNGEDRQSNEVKQFTITGRPDLIMPGAANTPGTPMATATPVQTPGTPAAPAAPLPQPQVQSPQTAQPVPQPQVPTPQVETPPAASTDELADLRAKLAAAEAAAAGGAAAGAEAVPVPDPGF